MNKKASAPAFGSVLRLYKNQTHEGRLEPIKRLQMKNSNEEFK